MKHLVQSQCGVDSESSRSRGKEGGSQQCSPIAKQHWSQSRPDGRSSRQDHLLREAAHSNHSYIQLLMPAFAHKTVSAECKPYRAHTTFHGHFQMYTCAPTAPTLHAAHCTQTHRHTSRDAKPVLLCFLTYFSSFTAACCTGLRDAGPGGGLIGFPNVALHKCAVRGQACRQMQGQARGCLWGAQGWEGGTHRLPY